MDLRYLHRHLESYLLAHPEDLQKMIFVAGPRQVGKTTLLEHTANGLGFKSVALLNWDRPEDRKKIRDPQYTFFQELLANTSEKPLVIFDELHKYPKWKSFLKGYYDTFRMRLATLVTGSARLDVYRRGGDSLLGRYWLFRLHPFSLSEGLGSFNPAPPTPWVHQEREGASETFRSLLRWGGFPEPFLHRSDDWHRRWVRMRRERLIQGDLRDLSHIQDLTHVENLMTLVQEGVGSPLSVNSLRESLDVSYNAVRAWVQWLEAIYYCFRIFPYSKRVTRTLRKEGKCYLYDWSEVGDPAARFENLVASHLKKSVDFWNDSGVGDFDLFYVRDRDKREVDFLILKEKKPWVLVECKLQDEEVPPNLHHMASLLRSPHNVLVNSTDTAGCYRVFRGEKFWVTGASDFLLNFV